MLVGMHTCVLATGWALGGMHGVCCRGIAEWWQQLREAHANTCERYMLGRMQGSIGDHTHKAPSANKRCPLLCVAAPTWCVVNRDREHQVEHASKLQPLLGDLTRGRRRRGGGREVRGLAHA